MDITQNVNYSSYSVSSYAQRLRAFLESRMMSGTFGNAGVLAAATTAYEQTISQTSSMVGVDKL